MDNFDLTKFLAEGKLFEETAGYAYASNSGDRIELWSEESLNDYVSGMAEDDYDGDKEAAMDYMKNENMLTRLPSSPYLFIYGNNESLDFFDANTKEEFVELINEEYHGGLEGDVDAMFAKILEYADNSYIDGDSSSQQIVIENGKVVGGGDSLSEGQLNEAMSPQDVVDIADTVAEEFTIESADEGDFLVYSVGKMDADDMSFELDTDISFNTPKNIDTRGVGEGWGGIFRIKPTKDGYEVRNAEKGGLVALIDNMGNFKMLSADESRAEMGLEEEQENKPSNKMKKSELKEMIKAAMLEDARTDAEQEGYKDGFEDAKEDVEDALKKMKVSEAEEEDVEKDVDVDVKDDENVDVDIEKDIEVDDEETEADIDVKASVSGESEDVEAVQGLLTKALEMSQALGDEKLEDQIGNTITYFTRAHVSRVNELDINVDDAANTEMEAELGLEEAKDEEVKENLNESVVFPMWNKIK